MYYSHTCTFCSKVFYTSNDNKETAANTLCAGIKAHLKEYGEDEKEHVLENGKTLDTNLIYSEMIGDEEAPSGGYEL